MTERDFDKIFQDKIGDELPFDFRPDDWLAAEQELDKLLPTVAPVAAVPRFLTWHKWAAAAAVLLLASQLFLMTELRNVKQEVVTLHKENVTLEAVKKDDNSNTKNIQSIVIQHDTIVKTIIVEVPQRSTTLEKELEKRGVQKNDFDNFIANQNAINERNEAGFSTNKRDKTATQKNNLAVKTKEDVLLNSNKIPLQTMGNASKNNGQKDNNSNDKKQLATNDLNDKKQLAANELNDKKQLAANELNDKKQLATNELMGNKDNDLLNLNKDKSIVVNLPNTQLATVKSIGRAKNWLNDEAFDFIPMSKMSIIKPISVPNGWEISVNSLFLNADEHRRSKPQSSQPRDNNADERLSIGANVRLGYNIKKNIRLSAEADFWSERHGQDINSRSPIVQLPSEYVLVNVEQTYGAFQIRIGADYKFRQIIGCQPFIGLGLAYQKRMNDGFEYEFKKNGNRVPPIFEHNDGKFNVPVSLGLRAGVEGKIYRRFGWSVDINAQRGATLSSHLGLKYAL